MQANIIFHQCILRLFLCKTCYYFYAMNVEVISLQSMHVDIISYQCMLIYLLPMHVDIISLQCLLILFLINAFKKEYSINLQQLFYRNLNCTRIRNSERIFQEHQTICKLFKTYRQHFFFIGVVR